MSPNEIWTAFNDPNLDGPKQVWIHLRISLIALTIASAVGIIAGVFAAKSGSRIIAWLVFAISNLGRTIPTFALMVLVVALSTIGERPAIVGLVLLGIPPVLLNAFTAIDGVDKGVVEAARGMGFGPLRLLGRVELPMSLPLIFAGIRISAIQIVATAVLAAAVGAGGLGVLILAGLANDDNAALLAGAIPTALLAMGVAGVLAFGEKLLTPKGLRVRSPRSRRFPLLRKSRASAPAPREDTP